MKPICWSSFYHIVLIHLDRLEEPAILTDDERVNAEEAWETRSYTPLEYAKKVRNDRDYAAAKWSGELWH